MERMISLLQKAKQAGWPRTKASKYGRLSLKLASLHKSKGGLTWHLIKGNVFDDAVVKASRFVGIVSICPRRGQTLDKPPTPADFERFIITNELMFSVPSNWLCVGSCYLLREERAIPIR